MLDRTSLGTEQCSLRLGNKGLGAFAGVSTLLALALLGAATGGSWKLEERKFPEFNQSREPVEMPTPALGPPTGQSPPFQPPPRQGDGADLSWLPWVALGIAVLAILFGIWWLWRRYGATGSAEQQDPRGLGSAMLTEESLPDVPVLQQGVEAAGRSLDQITEPNNAIVAAWLELEEASASSGVVRTPAQTPTEFTVTVLDKTHADAEATRQLLGLYHRARFSSEGVGPDEVERAKDCLTRLAASWPAVDPEAPS